MNFSDKAFLEVVPDIKLVGVILSNDLKWRKTATIFAIRL